MHPDTLITAFDRALRAIASVAPAAPMPAGAEPPGPELAPEEKREVAALMRVNHVGEVCAQALYHGQAATARTPEIRAHMERAAVEEGAHLAWTSERISELVRTHLTGADFAIGYQLRACEGAWFTAALQGRGLCPTVAVNALAAR